jgi:hypothetical protein
MIYRGSAILAVAIPFPPLSIHQVVSLSQSSCASPVRAYIQKGGGGGGGAKSYDGEKALLSLKHSIFSGPGEQTEGTGMKR